jgi:hypothetical protein
MMKYLATAAVAVIAFSGAAFAEDGKATAPKAMSDSEMDKVTAGAPGFGVNTACCENPLSLNRIPLSTRGISTVPGTDRVSPGVGLATNPH